MRCDAYLEVKAEPSLVSLPISKMGILVLYVLPVRVKIQPSCRRELGDHAVTAAMPGSYTEVKF